MIVMLGTLVAFAQEEKAVMKPVDALFVAMRKGDSAAIRKLFDPGAVLYTVSRNQQSGEPGLRKETLMDFLKAVGKPRTDDFLELTWNEKVQIDGDFAQVWADYAFYLNKTFHHCGVDAFQLVRNAKGEWVIFVLSDTRRKTDCVVPDHIQKLVK